MDVQYNSVRSTEELYIVPDEFEPLIGRESIRHLEINFSSLDSKIPAMMNINQIDPIKATEDLVQKFPEVFEERVGKVPNITCFLKLRQDVKPCYVKEREVPYALRNRVEQELDNLERNGQLAVSLTLVRVSALSDNWDV